MLRVLVVAPDQPGLNARPEIRQIQRLHHMSVLDGPVTSADIFDTCRETPFDIIHFATHGGQDGVMLSDNVLFTSDDIVQVARMHDTGCVVFNSCETARPAAHVVRRGIRHAIFATVELAEEEAWKLMVGFYTSLGDGAKGNVLIAFDRSDSSDGDYGVGVNIEYIVNLQNSVVGSKRSDVPVTRVDLARFAVLLMLACSLLTITIIYVARMLGG